MRIVFVIDDVFKLNILLSMKLVEEVLTINIGDALKLRTIFVGNRVIVDEICGEANCKFAAHDIMLES